MQYFINERDVGKFNYFLNILKFNFLIRDKKRIKYQRHLILRFGMYLIILFFSRICELGYIPVLAINKIKN